ncbi:MAG: TRAP transporter substrate-binding protein [Cyclobacteriaceae bacterium]
MSHRSKRREFLSTSAKSLTAGALGLAACDPTTSISKKEGPYINFNKTYRWKMTTTWPPNFPIMGTGCQEFAKWVNTMSGGRMEIIVYGGGELIPALEGFDAVSNGAVELNHGAAYYWGGKIPAAPFFTAVPFGMNGLQMDSWMIAGGGHELWQEVYEPHDLYPFPCGNTGVQMGGWFNKKIDTINDLKGVKMRIPGLAGKVFARAGGTPVLQSGGEIYTNLERGVIDAAEWIGPFHDHIMGFHRVAQYYYYPGWHETGPVLEMIANRSKFLELPSDLQEIIQTACFRLNRWMGAQFDAKNAEYLSKIMNAEGVTALPFPDEVLSTLKRYSKEVLEELASSDSQSRKVLDAYIKFQKTITPWMNISERKYYEKIMG